MIWLIYLRFIIFRTSRNIQEVIIPFSVAAEYAKMTGKGPVKFEDIHQVYCNYQKELLKSNTHRRGKQQVAILLGHYNHGKTTLLDSLSSTRHVWTEVDDITQEIRTVLSRLPLVELSSSSDDNLSFSDMVQDTFNQSVQTTTVAAHRLSESDGMIEDDAITGYRRGLTAYDKGDIANGWMCTEILDGKHQIISSLLYQRDLHA